MGTEGPCWPVEIKISELEEIIESLEQKINEVDTPSPSRVIFLKSSEPQSSRVGRTVPSFGMAAEIERTKWKQFRSLLDKSDRKKFDEMYDYVKLNNAACSNVCRPVVIHAVIMSIIFEHYKQLTKLIDQKKAKDKAKSNTLDLWT